MYGLVLLLSLLLVLRQAVAGYGSGDEPCTKSQFAAKFGADPIYEIDISENEPKTVDGEIHLTVKYETICSNGGSEFTPVVKSGMEKMDAIILERSEPKCCCHKETLDHTIIYTEDIQVTLPKFKQPATARNLFLAFPPDSIYEIYLLQKAGERVYSIEKEDEEGEDVRHLEETEENKTNASDAEIIGIDGEVDVTINAGVAAES